MKIEFSGVSFSGLYVRTLKLSIIRDLKLMLTKYFEKKTKKKPKKKEKKKADLKEAGNCVKVFWKKFLAEVRLPRITNKLLNLFYNIFKIFSKNTQGLTFTQYSGWTGKPPNLLCFFYFLCTD